jgi:hypothetical protein
VVEGVASAPAEQSLASPGFRSLVSFCLSSSATHYKIYTFFTFFIYLNDDEGDSLETTGGSCEFKRDFKVRASLCACWPSFSFSAASIDIELLLRLTKMDCILYL